MTFILGALAFLGTCGSISLGVILFIQSRESSKIRSECESRLNEKDAQLRAETARLRADTKQRLARYQKISDVEDHVLKLQGRSKEWKTYIKAEEDKWNEKVETFEQSVTRLEEAIRNREEKVNRLKAELTAVEESTDLQSFGFYEPVYKLNSSHEYKTRLDRCRAKQKEMVKSGQACQHDTTWTVEGSEAQGRKMMAEKEKLMLLAFNGEADAMISKVKFSNAATYEKRLCKAFDSINKLGKANSASLTQPYLDIKIEELRLVFEHAMKVQAEKEEQARVKEQMKEEAKAEAETQKAMDRAAKDEDAAVGALAKAKSDLASVVDSSSKQAERMQSLVADLENRLKEALDRKAMAIARARLTKSGHVYVLSNIGSFGDGVFKIGLTRRLDPQVRVKELGDASVPFPFDVHAMIYSENAPELERKLHNYFENYRVNGVNPRKEYFKVSIDEIVKAVGDLHGQITIVTVPEAEEYRQTVAMRQSA